MVHRDQATADTPRPQAAAGASAVSTTGGDTPDQQHRLHKRRLVLLLNKLTPTNFELHVSQYLTFVHEHGSGHCASTNYARDHDRFLRDAVCTIVDRAAEDGTRYSAMYANLCHRLSLDWSTVPSCIGTLPSFHDVLMEECQARLVGRNVAGSAGVDGSTEGAGEYQQHPIISVLMRSIDSLSVPATGTGDVDVQVHRNDESENDDDDDDDDDDDWRALLAKKLYLNHVLFVAEMFKCGAVTVQTITDVVHTLCRLAGLEISSDRSRASILLPMSRQLSMPLSPSLSAEEREVRLEALLLFLDRMGFKLEIPPLSTTLEEIGCWEALHDLTDMAGNAQDDQDVMNRRLTNRLRFMIMDLVELRTRGWRRSGPLQQRKMIMAESLDAFRADEDGTDSMKKGKKRMKKKKKMVSFGAPEH